jgi:hypothetical protein
MKSKRITIAVILALLWFSVSGQKSSLPYIKYELEKDIKQLFIDEEKLLHIIMPDSCIDACIYLKFQIDKNGMIKDVYTSYSIYPVIDSFLCKVFRKTNGKWKPEIREGETVVSCLYVLPFYFQMHYDQCGYNRTIKMGSMNLLTDNRKIVKPKLISYSTINPAEPMECILLNPIVFKN